MICRGIIVLVLCFIESRGMHVNNAVSKVQLPTTQKGEFLSLSSTYPLVNDEDQSDSYCLVMTESKAGSASFPVFIEKDIPDLKIVHRNEDYIYPLEDLNRYSSQLLYDGVNDQSWFIVAATDKQGGRSILYGNQCPSTERAKCVKKEVQGRIESLALNKDKNRFAYSYGHSFCMASIDNKDGQEACFTDIVTQKLMYELKKIVPYEAGYMGIAKSGELVLIDYIEDTLYLQKIRIYKDKEYKTELLGCDINTSPLTRWGQQFKDITYCGNEYFVLGSDKKLYKVCISESRVMSIMGGCLDIARINRISYDGKKIQVLYDKSNNQESTLYNCNMQDDTGTSYCTGWPDNREIYSIVEQKRDVEKGYGVWMRSAAEEESLENTAHYLSTIIKRISIPVGILFLLAILYKCSEVSKVTV